MHYYSRGWYVISGVLVIALIAVAFLFIQTSGGLKTANTEITSLRNDAAGFQNDIAARQGNIDSLNSQLAAEKASSANLQTQLAAAQANVTRLTSDLNAAQTSLTTAQWQIKTMQANLDAVNVSVTRLTSDLAAANTKVATTQVGLEKVTADLAKATAELAAINAGSTGSQAQIANLQAQLVAVQAQLTAVQAQLTALQAKSPPKAFPDVTALQTWVTNNMSLITAAAGSGSLAPSIVVQNKALSDGWIVFAGVTPSPANPNAFVVILETYVGASVYAISLNGASVGSVVFLVS